jgi:hypothetical protein
MGKGANGGASDEEAQSLGESAKIGEPGRG